MRKYGASKTSKLLSVGLIIIEVAIGPAGLYTNLYNTYVEGMGQVPGKKYTILYRTSCRTNSHFEL